MCVYIYSPKYMPFLKHVFSSHLYLLQWLELQYWDWRTWVRSSDPGLEEGGSTVSSLPTTQFLGVLGIFTCFTALLILGRSSSIFISYFVGEGTPELLPGLYCAGPHELHGAKALQIASLCLFYPICKMSSPWVSKGSTCDDRNNRHHSSTRVHQQKWDLRFY